MKKIIALVALLLIGAVLLGCTQQNPPSQQPPSQQPPQGQPQVNAMPIEDIAADAMTSDLPSGYENLTEFDGLLASLNS